MTHSENCSTLQSQLDGAARGVRDRKLVAQLARVRVDGRAPTGRRRFDLGAARLLVALAVAWALAALGACAPAPTPGIPGVPLPLPDVSALEDHLEKTGVEIGYLGEADVDWFEVIGRFYEIPRGPETRPDMLYVHEYENVAAAADELARMAPDGKGVILRDGTDMRIEWLGSPHVYSSGPMIIVYVGNSAEVTEALEAGLGPQVAGVGPPIAVPIKGES